MLHQFAAYSVVFPLQEQEGSGRHLGSLCRLLDDFAEFCACAGVSGMSLDYDRASYCECRHRIRSNNGNGQGEIAGAYYDYRT